MTYDPNNIFAKIIRGDIPCKKAYEDDHVLAFHDIHPQAPVHILVIPKGAYKDIGDFSTRASADEMAALTRAIGKVVGDAGVDKTGYRVLSNCGVNGGQEVPHLHFHVVGGRKLGRMLAAAE